MRVECLYFLGTLEESLQDFDAVMRLDPNYVWNGRSLKEGRKSFVQWLYDNKDFRGVITILGIMLNDNPSDIESLWYVHNFGY